jgi:hypothetical protein
MSIRTKIKFCCFILFISTFYINSAEGQSNENELETYQKNQDTTLLKSNTYIEGSAQPVRLLFDYYHHQKPDIKIGDLDIVTGGWKNNSGRYAWNDFVHTNSFDPVFIALSKEFSISMTEVPFSDLSLSHTDAVIMINPDNPEIIPSAKVISDEEIEVLHRFVKDGGSLMVTINGGDNLSESFEEVHLRKLMRSFGLDWNNDNTHASDIQLGNEEPFFYDVPVFHYGGGCTLKILQNAKSPEVLMNVYSNPGYTDSHVKGPGIVLVRYGKGKVILIGDTGSWTGNLSRPWDDNQSVLMQLFRYLKPDAGVVAPQIFIGKSWNYAVTEIGVQDIPVQNSLSKIYKPLYKAFYPSKNTSLPYYKATADLQLTVQGQNAKGAHKIEAKVNGFKWWSASIQGNTIGQTLNFIVSRQGKVSQLDAKGEEAKWMASDVPVIVALLPVNGIRIGDRWETRETLQIPIIRGSDLAPLRKLSMEVVYAGDTTILGHHCRLLQASGDFWLDKLEVTVKDLLPEEEVRLVGGPHYQFFSHHGGKLLFKREQWVDRSTGIVVKARIQTRIVAWLRDLRKPLGANNEINDENMVTSLAHIATFILK